MLPVFGSARVGRGVARRPLPVALAEQAWSVLGGRLRSHRHATRRPGRPYRYIWLTKTPTTHVIGVVICGVMVAER